MEAICCPVCKQGFDAASRRGMVLPCGHSLCLACVSKIPYSRCPLDKSEFLPDQVKVNYALEHVLVYLSTLSIQTARLDLEAEEGPAEEDQADLDLLTNILESQRMPPEECSKCGDAVSELYCKICKDYLCSNCDKETHTRRWESHVRVDASKVLPSFVGCKDHPDEIVKFMCITCGRTVCRDCTHHLLGSHSNHRLLGLAEAVSKAHIQVVNNFNEGLERVGLFVESVQRLSIQAMCMTSNDFEQVIRRKNAAQAISRRGLEELKLYRKLTDFLQEEMNSLEQAKDSPVGFFALADLCRGRFQQVLERYRSQAQRIRSCVDVLNESSEVSGGDKLRLDDLLDLNWKPLAGLIIDSLIIDDAQKRQIVEWMDMDLSKMTLLYRGSRDGFSASAFHRLCDFKGPTLVVVRSNGGYIFGGYSGIAWNPSSCWQTCSNAWLFSLNSNVKMMIRPQCTNNAIYCHQSYGPVFGAGNDLLIFNNNVNSNMANTGTSYELPEGYDRGSILAGTNAFVISEIEVFLVE